MATTESSVIYSVKSAPRLSDIDLIFLEFIQIDNLCGVFYAVDYIFTLILPADVDVSQDRENEQRAGQYHEREFGAVSRADEVNR
jgi:hypothetical protein